MARARRSWPTSSRRASAPRRPIRASVDHPHHPRAVRYARGRHSPEGYFRDSFDYPRLHALLLDPLGPAGNRRYRARAFDHTADAPVNAPTREAPLPSVLLFDGIFLHRPELRDVWDYSIFLQISAATSVRRCAERDGTCQPQEEAQTRYVQGQQLYLEQCTPSAYASRVILNEDLARPELLK